MKTKLFGILSLSVIMLFTMASCSNDDEIQDLGEGIYLINGHRFVDLGLPSGLLWAETNIGAETAIDPGDYFAWGETKPKSDYNEDTYKYGGPPVTVDELILGYTYTKYNDGKTTLDKEDDAAYVNWGASCRTPTRLEWVELRNSSCCLWDETHITGSYGWEIECFKVTSLTNGNCIYLPTTGSYHEDGFATWGYNYWSSTLDYLGVYCMNFYTDPSDMYNSINYDGRTCGQCVRPVAKR